MALTKPIVVQDVTDPSDRTPSEPMTEIQAVKLRELCEKHGEPFDGNLTETQAQDRIEALEAQDDSEAT